MGEGRGQGSCGESGTGRLEGVWVSVGLGYEAVDSPQQESQRGTQRLRRPGWGVGGRGHLAAAVRSVWTLVPSGEGRTGPTRAARRRAMHQAIQEAKINGYLFLVLFIDSKSLC